MPSNDDSPGDSPESSPHGDSESFLTRRRVLAALGAGGVGTAVYGTQFYVPEEPEANPPDAIGTVFSTPRVGTGGFDPGPWTFLGHHTSAPRGRESTGPAVGPAHVYVADVVRERDGLLASVYAIDPSNGTVAWEHRVDVENARQFDPALEPILSVPTVVDGTLYVGLAPVVDSSPTHPEYVGEEAGVLALSTETGERQWFQRLGFLPDSLGVADGVLVAGNRENVAVVADESG